MPGNSPVKVRGIHHIALVVPCLERAQEFYVGILGFELVDQAHFSPSPSTDKLTELTGAECDMIMVKTGSIFIEIFEFQTPTVEDAAARQLCDHGFTHLALEVEDVIVAWEQLQDAGVRWHCPPQDMGDGYLMCYGRDPFGNVLEIQQVAETSEVAFSRILSNPV
ncbi:MAG: VOC family protein [Halioglobus sp.]